VLIGEFKSGRIITTLTSGDVTGLRWSDELNAAGSITGVTIPEPVVRKYHLREHTHGWRNFLAVEVDGRIVQAGPVTSRTWDWESGTLTLGAAGLWAYLDRVKVRISPLAAPIQRNSLTIAGKSLGGIARGLVAQLLTFYYTQLPIVLPPDEAGDHEETFPMWKLLTYGEQIRQITQRAVDAPDVRFVPRRKAGDPRFLEWVMQVGTDLTPQLFQAGPDWVFDTTAPKSPVLGISTDEDPTEMAQRVYLTGYGQEEDILMVMREDNSLLERGWPRTDADDAHHTVERLNTLAGHAEALLARRARPIEVWRLTVRARRDDGRPGIGWEVMAGDYCQVTTKGDAWIPDGTRTMRVKTVTGDLSDNLTLEMYPMAAQL